MPALSRQFDRGLSCPLPRNSAILPGSKSSCLLLRTVLHDEVTEPENAFVHVQLQTKGFVDHLRLGMRMFVRTFQQWRRRSYKQPEKQQK